MANFQLRNDQIATFNLRAYDPATGKAEIIPPGDVFTATSSNPEALNAAIAANAAGNPTLVVNALVPEASGITVTVADSAGLTALEQGFDIVSHVTGNLMIDIAEVTHQPQDVPGAKEPPPVIKADPVGDAAEVA